MSTLKRAARRLLRPLLEPILRRVDETRHIAVELDRALPLVRSSIESQNAELRASERHRIELRAELDRVQEDLARAQQQIEALRDEFTLALGAGARREALRLSFGGEARDGAGHTFVDVRHANGADLAAELRGLPFAEGSAAEIRASGILERFSLAELRDTVLPYWRGLLAPGGTLIGDGVPAADLGALVRLLEETGYESIETVSRWREGATRAVEIRARPAAQTVARPRNSEVHAG